MFWDIMNAITNAVFTLGTYLFDFIDTVGAVPTIIALNIIALFVGFVILHSSGTSILGAVGSDRADRMITSQHMDANVRSEQRAINRRREYDQRRYDDYIARKRGSAAYEAHLKSRLD